MKVLSIGSGWYPEAAGGCENVFYSLANHLPACGISVRGLVPGSSRPFAESEGRVAAFAPLELTLPRRLWSARCAIHSEFEKEKPDLVASHFALYTLPGLDVVKRRPFVVHFHGPWALESALEGSGALAVRAKARIEREVYRHARTFIVLSQAFADVLARHYRISPSRIRIVPGGVDCARFDTPADVREARQALSWPQDRPIILVVRRLARRMGLSSLIAAIGEVRKAHPDICVMIGGRGPERMVLEAEIRERNLQDNIKLIGFVSDELLPLAYRAATFSVVPSTNLEGFGLVAVESLASGTPVFVTPVGGLPEVVRGLAPQLVLPGTAANDIAEAIKAALRGTLTLPSAEACRRYARENFDWSVIARRVEQVYVESLH